MRIHSDQNNIVNKDRLFLDLLMGTVGPNNPALSVPYLEIYEVWQWQVHIRQCSFILQMHLEELHS